MSEASLESLEMQIQQMLEGRLSADEYRALAAVLQSDAAARVLYHEMVQLHGLLHWQHAEPLSAIEPLTEKSPVENRHEFQLFALPVYGALAAALVLAAALWSWVQPLEPRPQLAEVTGSAWIERANGRVPARSGMPVQAGDRIVTASNGSAVMVFRGEATRIELSADTRCRLDWVNRAKQLNLESGYLSCEVAKQPSGRPMVLKTSDARAVVLGTRFSLSAGEGLTRLAVTEGSVRLEDARSTGAVKTEAGWIAEVGAQMELGKRRIADLVLADEPVAYWRLNGPAGTQKVRNLAATEQGVNLDGRIHAVEFNRPGPPTDLFPDFETADTSADFDGHNDYIVIRDPSSKSPFDFANGDAITLEAWVNLRSIRHDTQIYIVGKGRTNNRGFPLDNHNWGMRLRGEGPEARLSFIFRDRDNRPHGDPGYREDWHRWVSHAGFLPGSGWHHVAVSYVFGDGHSLRGYIDGRLIDGFWDYGGKSNEPPVVDDDDVWIGSAMGGSGNSTFNGQIEEVAVYRRVLAPEQVGNHFRRAR